MEWIVCTADEDLLGEREGHCAAVLACDSDAAAPWVVVVGGYGDGALSGCAVATPTSSLPALRWTALQPTPAHLESVLECDGASLTAVSPTTALLFGGLDAALERRNTTYTLHLATPTLHLCELSVTGATPAPRSRHGAGADAGRLYIFGGDTDVAAQTDDLFVLDIATGVWRGVSRAGPWPAPRFNALSLPILDTVGFVLHGGATVATGDVASLDDVWVFSVATSSWTPLATSFPRSNGHVGGVVTPDVVVFVGGKDNAEGCDAVRVVHYANGTWTTRVVFAAGPAPHWRFTPAAVVVAPSRLLLLAGQCRHPSPDTAVLLCGAA